MGMRFTRRVYHRLLLVPRLPSLVRHLQGDHATIFYLHRVRDGDPRVTGIEAKCLRSGLAYLRRNRYELISLTELFRRLEGDGPRLRGAVAFTIDDGYLDQAELAGPIFSEFDCPVTAFVATGFLDGIAWLWWDKAEYVFSNTRRTSLAVELGGTEVRYDLSRGAGPRWANADFVARCKVVSDAEKHRAIARLAEQAEVDLPSAAPSRYAPMTWDHVRSLERRGMTFGAHSVTHPILSRTETEQATMEITESWRRVREEARHPVPIFCYPNGHDSDFGEREVAIVRKLGFVGALSSRAGFVDAASFQRGADGPFTIMRQPFPEDLSVLAQYAGGIERLKHIVRRS